MMTSSVTGYPRVVRPALILGRKVFEDQEKDDSVVWFVKSSNCLQFPVGASRF